MATKEKAATQSGVQDESAIDGVECEILAPIRYGREKVKVGETADGRPILSEQGKPRRLKVGDTEVLTLDEAERYEGMGAVKILMSAKNREALRARLKANSRSDRREAVAE